jgi:gamma-glutamylputrescine oxidase
MDSASYWQRTSNQVTLSADLPPTADVAVVGAGLLGAATSYWLARAGLSVVLLERTAPAYGATGRNGGIVSVGPAEAYPAAIMRLGHETARAIWTLTLENRALLRQVLAAEGIACDYREPGHLSLALGEDQLAGQSEIVAALQADGFTATLLDRPQAQTLIDTPLGPEIAGGKFTPGNGLVHSARLVQGLVGAAQRHGARACVATVTQVLPEGPGVLIRTPQADLHAGAVLIATNAWIGELVPALAGLITPVRGQALAYAAIAPVFTTGISVAITPTGEYWQQTIDGSIVLGGCRAVAPGQDIGIRESQPTTGVQAALEQVIPRLFPQLGGLRVQQRWAGLMAFTPDYLPIADRAPGLPGVWVAGGFSGHGMPFGMRLGQLMCEAVTSGVAPSTLAHLRLHRPTLIQAWTGNAS